MKLSTRINILFAAGLMTTLIASFITYFSLYQMHSEYMAKEAQAGVERLLETQIPAFSQDYLANRLHGSRMRIELLIASNREIGLEVGMYLADGTSVFESGDVGLFYDFVKGRVDSPPSWKSVNKVIAFRKIEFAGRPSLNVLFAAKPETEAGYRVRDSLYIWSSVLVISVIFLFLVTRIYFSKVIVQPMESLAQALPRISEFLSGNKADLSLPKNFAVTEMNTLSEALERVSSELKDSLNSQQIIRLDLEREMAIRKTAQMLAHDVRKPFSLIESSLVAFEHASTMNEIQSLLKRVRPEVKAACSSVHNMISDVMEISTTAVPITESVSPQELVWRALKSFAATACSDSNMRFHYSFEHQGAVWVDKMRIERAFLNLLTNACEAMHGFGDIWFYTRDLTDGNAQFVEFCVGNSNSFLPVHLQEQVFEAFYTSGKKGGTGLGLAIVKKIVQSHGGKIRCFSYHPALASTSHSETPSQSLPVQGPYVEFYFTLRAVQGTLSHDLSSELTLPRTSAELGTMQTRKFSSY